MKDKIEFEQTDKRHAATIVKLIWGVPTEATAEQQAIAARLRPRLEKMRARGYSAEHCARYAARLVR